FPPPSTRATANTRLDEARRFLVGCRQKFASAGLFRFPAKQGQMQVEVIFPRVHVARNERRRDRQAQYLFAAFGEQGTQAALGVEVKQLVAVAKVDQHRMTAARFKRGLNQSV